MHKAFKTFSRTAWETSDYGGFHQVLYDWPYIYCDPRFEIKPVGSVQDLGFYESKTLFKLFLKKASDYKLIPILLEDVKADLVTRSSMFSVRSEYYYEYTFNKEQIKKVLKSIISADSELRSLFTNYAADLAKSEMIFRLPQNDANGCDINTFIGDLISNIKEQTTYSTYKPLSKGDLKVKTKFESIRGSVPVEFSSNENNQADTLSSMLDISFDQDSDKVSSLRCGKLDVVKLAEVVGGNTSIYYKIEEDMKTKPFSVCILVDESGSMTFQSDDENHTFHELSHSLTKVLYKAFSNIIPERDIFVYGHSGDVSPEIRVYHDRLNPGFHENISRQLDQDYRENYDGPVVECIYERIRSMTDANVLFIVISDGQPAGNCYGGVAAIEELKQIMEKCRRDGFVTVGIGFSYGGVKDIYSYYSVIDDFSDLSKQVARVVNKAVKTEFQ